MHGDAGKINRIMICQTISWIVGTDHREIVIRESGDDRIMHADIKHVLFQRNSKNNYCAHDSKNGSQEKIDVRNIICATIGL